jgi:hypothetical protein
MRPSPVGVIASGAMVRRQATPTQAAFIGGLAHIGLALDRGLRHQARHGNR